MTMRVAAATDIGLRRTQNEDSLGWWISPAGPAPVETLLVVADGMGGSRGGEVASHLAVHAVVEGYRHSSVAEPLQRLQQSVDAANRVVHQQSVANPDLRGMGTTCTAVLVRERHACFAHVGDSRAYRVRDRRIRQLTRDHSLVAQLVEERQITPEQARIDPRRNLVTRSVGVGPAVMIDAERMEGDLEEGDTLVLCTDGLHGVVTDDELATAAAGADLEVACRSLIGLARERGGPDNITVILARLDSAASDRPDPGPCYLPERETGA